MTDNSWTDRSLPNDDFRVANLMMLVERYMSAEDAAKVYSAFLFAANAHDGVMRRDGLPYITHPLEVARILADLHMDVDVIKAALLHDVVEDTDFTHENIVDEFGEATANLVDGVTKLVYEKFPNKQAALIATFHKMMKTMTEDFRVVLIKLSDRLHNLSTMSAVPMKTRIKKADESFNLYIPLARRMGMNKIRRDLQELALEAKYPWRSKVLKAVISKYVEENAERHEDIINKLTKAFDDQGMTTSIFRWPKNVYRIYSRLSKKGVKLNPKTESLDVRLLVSTRKECYQALCILHKLYQPKVGSFKDFIAIPKIYGFQALETCLLTRSQQTIKVQIQTHSMYQVAQYGVTAKWRYPELKKSADIPHKALQKWLSQVDEIYQYDVDVNDFYRDIQADLFLQEIYVFTPKGKSIVLPHGSNSIDFAYAIHSDLGNHCAETRVNGKKESLKMPLFNGAIVEIIRSEMASPHASWVNSVVTAKAKASIRSWLKKRKKVEFIALGKQVFNAALNQYELEDSDIDPEKFSGLLLMLDMKNENELWLALGKGEQCGKLVVHRLFSDISLPKLSKNNNKPMVISGTEGLVVNLQSCCYPIPGDRIIAKINPTQGLAVHRVTCSSLRNTDTSANDYLSVSWVKEGGAFYTSPLMVIAKNKTGVLSSATALMEQLSVNIENLNIESVAGGDKKLNFLIQVSSQRHLQKIINGIRKLENVIEVERPL